MDKQSVWKWLILVVLLALSLAMVVPFKDKEGRPRIRLGLDLKGGTSFAVEIDRETLTDEIRSRPGEYTEEEIQAEVRKTLQGAPQRALEVLRNRIDTMGIEEPIIYLEKDGRIVIQLPGIDDRARERAEANIRSAAYLEFRLVHEDNEELTGELFDKGTAPRGYVITEVGSRRFYRRDPGFPTARMDPEYYRTQSKFHVPDAEYEFMLQKEEMEGQIVYRPLFVRRRAEMKGDLLKNASVGYDNFNQPLVNLEFDGKGSKAFSRITSDYCPRGARNMDSEVGRQLAIVLDGTVYSAPFIRQAIHSGKAEITGSFSVQDATLLSNVLRAGSLPAPVRIVETRFISPSLGLDSIRSGILAVAVGGAAVLVFMLVYYLACGIIADMALVLNMLLLPLGMVVAGGFLGIFAKDATSAGPIRLPVLTLPGIAGILLTVGMAVDANVLIFERIREESKVGKRLWRSITAGYDRAFVTIVDANVTTLLTGVILFIFGSGPIRGFAVTLCAGIMVSMFTALVVTKLFFGVVAGEGEKKGLLRMLSIVKDTSIDFVSRRKAAAVVSVALILAAWGIMTARGLQNPSQVLGVDFTGGTAVTCKVADKVPLSDVRTALREAGLSDVHLQYQDEIQAGGASYLLVRTGRERVGNLEATDAITAALQERFPQAGITESQGDKVGAQVGRELKMRALWSIGLALLGIIVYISWRFELGFAAGAIVALAHDVLITVGLFSLFGRQITLPIVAALLTIVGYSVNDTIVVFDRIREDLRLVRNKSFKEICNLSINQTLSRTLLTSLTTLIAVVMLLVLGGGAINDFALALCIGVVVGTYSSIFVATPVVLLWHRDRRPEFAAAKS